MQNLVKTKEINNIISHLPEGALDEILAYLIDIQKKVAEKERDGSILNEIFEEDAEVLKKLAK